MTSCSGLDSFVWVWVRGGVDWALLIWLVMTRYPRRTKGFSDFNIIAYIFLLFLGGAYSFSSKVLVISGMEC